MIEVLDDTSRESTARAVMLNLYEFFRRLQKAAAADVRQEGGILRWRTPIAHPWFNGVLAEREAGPGDEAAVDEALAFFKGVPTGFTFWQEAPGNTWGPLLLDRGFVPDEHTPGMSIDLNTMREFPALPDCEIQVVADESAWRTWADVAATGFGIEPAAAKALAETFGGMGFDLPLRHYVAYLEGEPVATSSVFMGAGVAGIYSVATVAAARGKGIGAAVTAAGLMDGRALGYRVGILHASDMGFPVYERMGFEQVCVVDHHYAAPRA